MRTFEELCAAQAKGAELLDSENPNWAKDFNLDSFLFEDADYCVLGQVYGYYHTGLEILDLDVQSAPDYGFNGRHTDDYGDFFWEMETLTLLWREEIKARQNF